MTAIRLVVVDDHQLMRDLLTTRLDELADLEVAAAADNAQDAIRLCREVEPDVLVMDIDMPGLICFDAVKKIAARQPRIRTLFLSSFRHDHYINRALQVGGLGYVTKSEPFECIVDAIRGVAHGHPHFSQEILDRLIVDAGGMRLARPPHEQVEELTGREVEVLRYIARGLARKEIAEIMHVSTKTVDKHTDNLMAKVNIHNRVELMRFAIRTGLAEA